jgi:hypothetical protein
MLGIVTSSWWIVPFINMKWPSLPLLSDFSLKPTLSDTSIGAPAYLGDPFAWIIFFYPFTLRQSCFFFFLLPNWVRYVSLQATNVWVLFFNPVWWFPSCLTCSIHIFLACFHSVWLSDLISLLRLLFLIMFNLLHYVNQAFNWGFYWNIELFISNWLFFRISIAVLISSFISYMVFLISFICLNSLWARLVA